MAKAVDLFSLAEKLGDDAEIELGGEKFTGADLKSYLNETRQQLTTREQEIAAAKQEFQNLQGRFSQFESSTSALMRAAAAEAARDTGGNDRGAQPPAADPEWSTYESDPLFGPFSKAYEKRLMQNVDTGYFKPWVEKELMPTLNDLRRRNGALETMLIDERQRREYRDLGEWPDKFGLDEARRHATERGYFIPGTVSYDPQSGRQVGIVDLHRVHNDVVGPIRQSKREDQIRQEAREEAARQIRAEATIISPPNRTMNGQPLPKAKGKTPEEIFGNVINEAAADLETQRALGALSGR